MSEQQYRRPRPDKIVMPGPRLRPEAQPEGQESVWDYPRPPRVERVERHVRVEFGGALVAETT
jgi:hypothetical protein